MGQSKMPLDSLYLSSKITYFTIEDGQMKGEGLNAIKSIFSQSQFVCLGEKHQSKQISILVKAMVPFMKENNFTSAAFEVGPYSSKVLSNLSSPYEETIENLKEFNTKYYVKPVDFEPLIFFFGVEDAEFLQEISKNNINIWGLDQEFLTAPYFFMDLLFNNLNKEQQVKCRSLKLKATGSLMGLYRKDSLKTPNFNVYREILNDSDMNNYFTVFHDSLSKDMIKELRTSFEIYSVWDKPGGHKKRIDYMKGNFMKNYALEEQKEMLPKVFLKFGDVHMSKALSLGVFDLGNLTEELAKSNDTKSTSINCLRRYYFDSDSNKITDNMDSDVFRDFKRFATKDKWGIIDVASIKKDIENNKVGIDANNKELSGIINGFDYIFLMPMDSDETDNIEK